MDSKQFNEDNYKRAAERVKKIKGFYTHALVYVVINAMLIILHLQRLDPGENFFVWYNFSTLFFWGIGLLAHAVTVFTPTFLFGKDWEERKIKELMEKNKNRKNWE